MVELALSLPFLILLIVITLNAYYFIHTSHVGQSLAAMNLYQRVNHRAVMVKDDFEAQVVTTGFMAAETLDGQGKPLTRKIVRTQLQIRNVAGVCGEPTAGPCLDLRR